MADRVGERFERLVEIMRALRAPDGCPWDREQTHATLRPFVLEETYEVLEAIESGQPANLCEELGDFLFEAVFLAQICEEEGRFSIADSIQSIADKLIRRHPHIFDPSGRPLETPTQVHQQWEQIKAREQSDAGERRSVLRGLPRSLPSLLRAYEIGTRVAAVGFDWARTEDVVDKIEEEVRELRSAVASEGAARSEEEMGDLLFSIANLSRKLGIEPEAALRRATDKFTNRFDAMERAFAARGTRLNESSLDDMEAEWQRVKQAGKP